MKWIQSLSSLLFVCYFSYVSLQTLSCSANCLTYCESLEIQRDDCLKKQQQIYKDIADESVNKKTRSTINGAILFFVILLGFLLVLSMYCMGKLHWKFSNTFMGE